MTTSTPPEPTDDDHQEHGDVVAQYETVRVRDRLVQRTCGWCSVVLRYGGVGRPPKFCCDDHRKRWHERENAKKALGLDTAAPEPVREVIERTETRVRTVVRKGPTVLQPVPVPTRPEPGGAPTTVDGWYRQLRLLLAAARSGEYTEDQRTALADVFTIAAEHLRAGPAGVAPVPEQQPGVSRAERRRRERAARKGRG